MNPPLPIDDLLPEITQTLRDRGVVVVVAEPGAGKTTRVPPAVLSMLEEDGDQGDVVLLQPRRVAARLSAQRIAEEQGCKLGERVGYHVRFDKKVGPQTKLRVLTEGLLTRQLVADPFLEKTSCVILDEFHERSLDVDLAIAMLQEVREAGRDDLKIVVMSATIDAEQVAAFFGGAPIVRVPGRTFPIEVSYQPLNGKPVWELAAEIAATPNDGDTLVFMPGVYEISKTQAALAAKNTGLDIRILHGSLDLKAQQAALAPSYVGGEASGRASSGCSSSGGGDRVIVSTNIAETSLTIDGVVRVIDSGLARQSAFDPQRGLNALNLVPISQASADQRAGRSGRTAAGRCVRLWTQQEQHARPAFEPPEVRRVDLSQTLLTLRAFGTPDPRHFAWFERPPEEAIDAAEQLLVQLGAIEAIDGPLTKLGHAMAALPVHPRLGRLMIEAVHRGVTERGATLAALLSERDIGLRGRPPEMAHASDLSWRADAVESSQRLPRGVDGAGVDRVRRVRQQLLGAAKRIDAERGAVEDDCPTDLVLPLVAFPDRVCQRREQDPTRGVMAFGGGVRLHPNSAVKRGDYFLALDAQSQERGHRRAQESAVYLASRVDPDWLKTLVPQLMAERRETFFDDDRQRVIDRKRLSYGQLILAENIEAPKDAVAAGQALARAVVERLDTLRAADREFDAWLNRLAFASLHDPAGVGPFAQADGIPGAIAQACYGKTNLKQFKLLEALLAQMSYPQLQAVDRLAPPRFQTPAGVGARFVYDPDPTQPPVLAVRIQTLFGLDDTPCVAGGRVAAKLHLLAPNQRPAQVTDDLSSFWRNTYPQVRKDLRARYPKHAWPEDPLAAKPSAKGVRRD